MSKAIQIKSIHKDNVMKIVKVTKEYFETEDGRRFEHPIELDEVPSVEEFQEIYDGWEETIKSKMESKKDDK